MSMTAFSDGKNRVRIRTFILDPDPDAGLDKSRILRRRFLNNTGSQTFKPKPKPIPDQRDKVE